MLNYYEDASEDLSMLNEMGLNNSQNKVNDISLYSNNDPNPLNLSKLKIA